MKQRHQYFLLNRFPSAPSSLFLFSLSFSLYPVCLFLIYLHLSFPPPIAFFPSHCSPLSASLSISLSSYMHSHTLFLLMHSDLTLPLCNSCASLTMLFFIQLGDRELLEHPWSLFCLFFDETTEINKLLSQPPYCWSREK